MITFASVVQSTAASSEMVDSKWREEKRPERCSQNSIRFHTSLFSGFLIYFEFYCSDYFHRVPSPGIEKLRKC